MSQIRMRRALVRWWWPAMIVVSALAVIVMTLLQVQGPMRAIVVVWFLTVCPGMAWTRVVGFTDVATRWTVAIAASVSLEVALATGMTYAQVFSPTWGLGVVVGVAVLGAIADVLSPWDSTRETGGERA